MKNPKSTKIVDKSNFGNLYQTLNDIKARYLQLEAMNKKTIADKIIKDFSEQIKGTDEMIKTQLAQVILELGTKLSDVIPQKAKDAFSFSDYEAYTSKNYGNLFWNEIDHPAIIDDLFKMLVKAFGLVPQEPDTITPEMWLLRLYDLKGFEIIFNNQDEINNFICENDVTPANSFERSSEGDCWIEAWSV